MKKTLIIGSLLFISSVSQATEVVYTDQIRGGVSQIQVYADNNENYQLLIFLKTRQIEIQPIQKERVAGVHISNTKNAWSWPILTSVKYSVRFFRSAYSLSNDDTIVENVSGSVGVFPADIHGHIKWGLGLSQPHDAHYKRINFDEFYSNYINSNGITVEINSSKQLTFTR